MSDLPVVCTGLEAAGISPVVQPQIWTLESLENARAQARGNMRVSRSSRPQSFLESGSEAVRAGFANTERPLNTRITA